METPKYAPHISIKADEEGNLVFDFTCTQCGKIYNLTQKEIVDEHDQETCGDCLEAQVKVADDAEEEEEETFEELIDELAKSTIGKEDDDAQAEEEREDNEEAEAASVAVPS